MFGRRGQSTLEYAVVIAVIVAALVVMQLYIRRGVQGRLRQSADDMGEQFAPSVSYNWNTTYNQNVAEDVDSSARITTNYTTDQQTRSGTETVNMQADNYWPQGTP